jgi:hypothetical protein
MSKKKEVKTEIKKDTKVSGKGFKFRTGDEASYNSEIYINGEKLIITCIKGIIETESKTLSDHLRTMYQEIK